MRFLTLIFLSFIFIFPFNHTSFAQGAEAAPVAEIIETTNQTDGVEEGNVFSRASNEQINEAQRFYKKCKENDTLSARKDCKCAATSYLESRLDLGSEATVEQIIAANINTCLLDEKSMIEKPEHVDTEVTQEQMQEAESVYNWCKAKKDMRNQFDCECLAAEFLGQRVESGPVKPKSEILGTLTRYGKCKNMVESTGIEYQYCMGGSMEDVVPGIDQKKYCECYARTWAKRIEDHKGKLGQSVKANIRYYAGMACMKPEAYK